jgi:nucleotide-binding universal stress UspA family protein
MKKIIIGLDLTDFDATIASYFVFIATYWQPEKIYILYVTDTINEFQEEKQLVWNTDLPMEDFFKAKLQAIIQKYFPIELQEKTNYIIGEGNPHEEMLHWAVAKQADLMVIGRKFSLTGSEMLPQQFALRTPCSVLLVPEMANANLDTVLVSIDFSVYAKKAVEVAIELVEKVPYSSLYCQYIFDIPSTWLNSESSFHQEIKVAKHEAEKNYEKFMFAIDSKAVRITSLLSPGNEDEDFIRTYENAKDIDASLLIVGTKGRSFISRFFDQSFTQKMIEQNNKIPLLLVKSGE